MHARCNYQRDHQLGLQTWNIEKTGSSLFHLSVSSLIVRSRPWHWTQRPLRLEASLEAMHTVNATGLTVVNDTEVLDAVTRHLQTYTDYYNAFYVVLQNELWLRRSVGTL